MAIPQDYIYELVQRSDIADVIGSYVSLKHQGRISKGLCPFHNEKTPSFTVYPETQSYYCFGCGEGGDVINFVKKINNIDYVEAVKLLAARAGMPMPDEDDTAGRLRSRVLAINKESARFFYEQLNAETGKQARAYWRGRGLSDSTIRRFGLGYAPNSFNALLKHLKSLGYTDDELLKAAVVKKSEKGNLYDVFRNRVMVPIFDLRGNIIAFGGRNMGDEKPKYINSPETIAYKKSRTLFALNTAKKSPEKRYILCEGYMDVISMHQAGFTTAVAGCGTALTSEQVKLLSEYANEVVLLYDSDEAGQKAAKRAIELFSYTSLKVSVLKVTDAKDPDEFIKKFGAERFRILLNGANNAIEYELENIRQKYDIASSDGRLSYIKEAIEVLSGRTTPTERDVYAGRLAEQTNIAKTAILSQLDKRVRQKYSRDEKKRQQLLQSETAAQQIKIPTEKGGARALGVAYAEQQLMAAVIKNPDFYAYVADMKPESFIDAGMAQVLSAMQSIKQNGGYIDLPAVSREVDEKTTTLLSRILAQNYDVGFAESDVKMYIERICESVPLSQKAATMSDKDIQGYIERLKRKKQ